MKVKPDMALLHSTETGSGVKATSYSMGTEGTSNWGLKLSAHLHLVSHYEWNYTSTPLYIFTE
jgi:hypothetical protein